MTKTSLEILYFPKRQNFLGKDLDRGEISGKNGMSVFSEKKNETTLKFLIINENRSFSSLYVNYQKLRQSFTGT